MASYHLSPFDVGQVKAHLHHGLGPAAICALVKKSDGKTSWSLNAIKAVVDRLQSEPAWRGERSEGSGRPRETTAREDKATEQHILANAKGRSLSRTSSGPSLDCAVSSSA